MPIHDFLSNSDLFIESERHRVNLRCKFIQINNNDVTHCVIGDLRTYPYHAKLAEKYCTINNIAGSWHKKPDKYEIFERHIDIKGGGWLEFDFNAMTVKVFGYSTAYGSFEPTEILPLLQGYQPFSAFSILQD